MTAGNPNSHGNGRDQFHSDGRPDAEESPAIPQAEQSLDRLLEETRQTVLDREFFQTIVGFRRNHADDQELDQETLLGLVRLILLYRFPKTKIPDGCDQWICELLFFDPISRKRIESLWSDALDYQD